ncbi:MAG: hypothetical protein ACRD0K_03495 [Egibacteraceae bacterium]
MNAAAGSSPLTARWVLFDDDDVEGAAAILADSLGQGDVTGAARGVLDGFSSVTRQAADRELARVAAGVADLDIVDVIIGGWRKHAALTAAARRSVAVPGGPEVVDLATHRITSVHQPHVDLLFDGVRVATVDFELSLDFVVRGLVATVRDGRLVALDSGRCDVTATLAVEGVEIAKRQRHLDLRLVEVRLGQGVPLLGQAEMPPQRTDSQHSQPERPQSESEHAPQQAPSRSAAPGTGPNNTSGQGNSAVVPPEVLGWNWGAFLLGWIWGLGNLVYIALLTLIPLVGFAVMVVLGLNGSAWAWQQRQWDSIEHFQQVQRTWAFLGFGYLLFEIAVISLIIA